MAQKTRKPMTSRGKGIIALAVLMIITLALSWLAIAGVKLDGEGVSYLQGWLPVTERNATEALPASLQLGGGTSVDYVYEPAEGVTAQDVADVLSARLRHYGATGFAVEVTGDNTVRVSLPNTSDLDMLKTLLVSVGQINFTDADGNVLFDNNDIASADVQVSGGYSFLQVKMTEEGKAKLTEATEKCMGKTMPIVLDGEQLAAPQVDEVNTTGGMSLSFGFTESATRAIAAMMAGKALPLKVSDATESVAAATSQNLLKAVLIVLWAVFAVACVVMVVRYRAAGLAGVWTLWVYMLIFFFLLATVAMPVMNLAVWAAALVGVLLAAYVCLRQLRGMALAVADGRDGRGAVRLGFHTSLKDAWLAHGVALVLSLLLMIFAVTRPLGYTLATAVVSSAFACMGLMRWFVPCLVCAAGGNAAAVSGKR